MKSKAELLFALVFGALLWTNGGVVKEAQAQLQNCGDGGYTTVINGGLMCTNGSGGLRPYGSHPDDGYGPRNNQNNSGNNTSNSGSWNINIPAREKPSSYGAVAWGKSALGSSSNQTTKQNAIDDALRKCESSGAACKIQVIYSNQCVAQTYGVEASGTYFWRISYGSTQSKAVQTALKDCGKRAKNCKVAFSECSLPDNLGSNQPQQYKGLGE